MAATKARWRGTAGIVKTRKNGRWFMMALGAARSVHDVFGKPFAPFGGLLRAQLGVDVDLLLPLFRGGGDGGQFRDLGIELGVEHRGAALFQLGDLGLDFRIVER